MIVILVLVAITVKWIQAVDFNKFACRMIWQNHLFAPLSQSSRFIHFTCFFKHRSLLRYISFPETCTSSMVPSLFLLYWTIAPPSHFRKGNVPHQSFLYVDWSSKIIYPAFPDKIELRFMHSTFILESHMCNFYKNVWTILIYNVFSPLACF